VKERSNALCRKIEAWYHIQQLYMPEVALLRANDARAAGLDSSGGIPDVNPVDQPLWLPSSIARRAKCSESLQRYEFRLREAQANDALNELRNHLLYTTYLWKHKHRFQRGVKSNTRSRTNIERAQCRVNAAAEKYRVARKALVVLGHILKESGWESTLRELRSEDVRGLSEASLGDSEGRWNISWIWRSVGIGENVDKGLKDGM
jgi:hypothetical protein